MEEEIQERLEKIFNFSIDVKFIDFRKYEIKYKIGEVNIKLLIIYDGSLTVDQNIINIKYKIEKEIINLYERI